MSRSPMVVPSLRGVRAIVVVALVVAGACSDMPGDPLDPAVLASRNQAVPALTVTWPTEGSHLSGSQVFQAQLGTWKLSSYAMTWSVDGGQQNPMSDSYDGVAHKQATVDVSSWTWHGTGPYAVTFTATSKGSVVGTSTVNVYVDQATTTPPPPPPPASSGNPLAGAIFWVDANSNAAQTVAAWQATRPADAAQMQKIASHSQADWFGGWSGDIQSAVNARATTIVAAGALPVFVAYNIPLRDCGGYSSGGATSADAYRTWIRGFAAGLAGRRALVVLEPDALAGMSCLSAADQQTRLQLIADAVSVLKGANAVVYIDAGHPGWVAAADMANRLAQAGIASADGFSLNVSNFYTTSDNATYGQSISGLVNGKHFIIDTSRNGVGPTADNQWCNPSGRALGAYASPQTGNALVDAFLWVKRPGESDGTCNGGPSAGAWWADYALGLAQNQPAVLASLARR